MSVRSILDVIKKGVEFAEGLTPILSVVPGIGAIVTTATQAINAVTEVVTNVEGLVTEGKVVFTSHDQAELQGYIERLAKANDELMAYIDAS